MEFMEPRGSRFEAALECFLDGKGMTFRGVNLWLAPDGYLEVRVHPDWRVDRDESQRSMGELCFSRCVVREISDKSPGFASATAELPWRMVKLNKSGTETIYLYCPEEGKVIWSLGLS